MPHPAQSRFIDRWLFRPLPDDVLSLLHTLSREAIEALSARDEWSARMQASFDEFQQLSKPNQKISEHAYLRARSLPVD